MSTGLILSRGQRRVMNAIEHCIAHQPKPQFTGPRADSDPRFPPRPSAGLPKSCKSSNFCAVDRNSSFYWQFRFAEVSCISSFFCKDLYHGHMNIGYARVFGYWTRTGTPELQWHAATLDSVICGCSKSLLRLSSALWVGGRYQSMVRDARDIAALATDLAALL